MYASSCLVSSKGTSEKRSKSCYFQTQFTCGQKLLYAYTKLGIRSKSHLLPVYELGSLNIVKKETERLTMKLNLACYWSKGVNYVPIFLLHFPEQKFQEKILLVLLYSNLFGLLDLLFS